MCHYYNSNYIPLLAFYKYLERLGITQNDLETSKTYNIFPDGWFSISLDYRIKIISYALKNNASLEESIAHYIVETEKKIKDLA